MSWWSFRRLMVVDTSRRIRVRDRSLLKIAGRHRRLAAAPYAPEASFKDAIFARTSERETN
jgi:hypothetical protein